MSNSVLYTYIVLLDIFGDLHADILQEQAAVGEFHWRCCLFVAGRHHTRRISITCSGSGIQIWQLIRVIWCQCWKRVSCRPMLTM